MRPLIKFHPGLVLVIFLFLQDLLALKLNAEPIRERNSVKGRRPQVPAFPASHTERDKNGTLSSLISEYVSSAPKLIRRGKGPSWSEEDDARLVELRGQGFTYKELTAYFPNRSDDALQLRHRKLTRDSSRPKRAPGNIWTDEEVKHLRALVKAGLPWKEIAEYFPGRTQAAAQARYKASLDSMPAPKVTSRPMPKAQRRLFITEEDELLKKLKEEGMSFKEMTSRFRGRSSSALAARYRRLSRLEDPNKIPSRKQWTDQEDRRLMRALELGMTAKEISEFLDRSPKAVYRRIAKLKDKGLLPRRK